MSPVVQTIKLSGSLDISHFEDFFQEIVVAAKSKPDILVVDMHDVSFIDNSGLGALISALTILKANGGRLALCDLSESVEVLIELTGTQRFFDILPGTNCQNAEDIIAIPRQSSITA
ncbi:STAS domain-containing protein [Pseudanabaena sp. PCC 6802]|uniref:STAS domain-containing protein n=1 Tax=Pseudanabaena sp. PCC 6802 TaxID=118173 RepID=UPI000344B893|nr:STAS domain-containing protein [Pseudanabaena sp. PCC 6802]